MREGGRVVLVTFAKAGMLCALSEDRLSTKTNIPSRHIPVPNIRSWRGVISR